MEIRHATVSDAKKISEIIRSLSQPFFTFPNGKGAEAFLESISENAVAIAIRDDKHLYHLFVVSSCQRRQLGRQLWEYAKAKAGISGNHGEFTVNSSMNAVPVYQIFGFKPTSEMKQANGVSFLPMALASS